MWFMAAIFVKFHEFSNIFVDLDSYKSANLAFSGNFLEALVFHIILLSKMG